LDQRLVDHGVNGKERVSEFLLEPATAAETVAIHVISGSGGESILPGRLNLVSVVQGMPSWLQ